MIMASRGKVPPRKTNDWLETIEVERVDDDTNSEVDQSTQGGSISTPILRKGRTSGSNDHTSDGDSDSEMLAGIAIIDTDNSNNNLNSNLTNNATNRTMRNNNNDNSSDDVSTNSEGRLRYLETESEQQRRRSRLRLMVIFLLSAILIIAVVSGSVCGSGKCPRGRSNAAAAAEAQLDPTLYNDVCEKAAGPLTIGKVPTIGLLSGLSRTSEVPLCSLTTIPRTGTVSGRWFKVTGGDEVIRASTCNRGDNFVTSVDTILTIYEGNDCSALTCVGTSDDFCGTSSSLSLWGKKGTNYFILVSMKDTRNSLNNTQRSIENSSSGAVPESFDFVLTVDSEDNGVCKNAIGPLIPTTLVDSTAPVIAGSLRGSLSQPLAMACDSAAALGGNVWYTVLGTGDWLKANTCHNLTQFEARLDITPGSCGQSSCASVRDSDCEGLGRQIVWKSELDTLYNLAVFKGDFSLGSTFGLTVEIMEPAINNDCDQPIAINADDSMVFGSTLSATFDFDTPSCQTSSALRVQPGVWYSITGTGKTMLASTCHNGTNFATEMSVFLADGRGCGASLSCVPSAQKQFCAEDKSAVYWSSEEGSSYLIHIHGSDYGNLPNVGDFALTVSDFVPAANDLCTNGILMDLVNVKVSKGSTLAATPDVSALSCGSDVNETPGVWYSIVGTGEIFRASTCNPLTNFDTQISIFSNGCDDAPVCVVQDDNSCGLQSFVTWVSDPNVIYHILVHGGKGSSVGDFVLSVDVYDPKQLNDFCDDAISTELGSTVYRGSTVDATYDNIGECKGVLNTSPGIWYSTIGTGRRITASLCNPETNYQAAITILSGNCSSYVCVAANQDSVMNGCSKVSWLSVLDEMYSILVHGFDDQVGQSGLTLIEDQPTVENDFCVDAIPIPISSDVITVSTKNATDDEVQTCMNVVQTGFGVWYTVVGNGRRLIASTCAQTQSTFDTKISVFTGNGCSNLTCVVADDNGCGLQSRAVWKSQESEIYYILVHGPVGGELGLVVDRFTPLLANDFCTAAQGPLIPNGEVAYGSTLDSSFDNVGYCGADNTSPGVWFFVVGTGERLTVDTCDKRTTFDTKLSIFTGPNCANLTCVTGNDDGCGLQSSISWDTVIGQFYFILLHGWGPSSFGSYYLTVSGSTYFD